MSTSLGAIIDGLRQIERRVTPRQLAKTGAIVREAEARHLLQMVADARETLERVERCQDL